MIGHVQSRCRCADQPSPSGFLHYWGTGPVDTLATAFKSAVSELGNAKTSTASK